MSNLAMIAADWLQQQKSPPLDEPTKDFTLIIGLQNSGKTTELETLYKAQQQAHIEGAENQPDAYFIDAQLAMSEWFNDPEVLFQLTSSDTQGRKLTNAVKGKIFVNYLAQQRRVVFIDNLHKVTPTKVPLVKEILERCQRVVMTTTDEGQIVLTLRNYIEHFTPTKIYLKSRWFIPTFDITPLLYGILIIAAVLAGYGGSAIIVAGLAVRDMYAWKRAKQI
jgi:hypothetical protein